MNDYDAKAIGARMRQARRAAVDHPTQDDIARRLGVKPRTYQRWENAETAGAMRHLDEIAAALGVTTAQLLGVEGGAESDLEAEVAELRARVDELTRLLRDPELLLREADALLREAPPAHTSPRRGD